MRLSAQLHMDMTNEIFHTVPGSAHPPDFPVHIELDLFCVFSALRSCIPPPVNFK